MTLQAISWDLQFECFDVKFVFEKFFSYHKFFVYDYVFDASLLFIIYSIHLGLTVQNFKNLVPSFWYPQILCLYFIPKFYLCMRRKFHGSSISG